METRNQQERRFAQKTQESKEAKLRELARQAREQRAGIRTTDAEGEREGEEVQGQNKMLSVWVRLVSCERSHSLAMLQMIKR